MLRLELVPVLETMRELYALPRTRERFDAYLRAMIGADGTVRLPLPVMNPLAKEAVAARLDELIALGAEATARDALDEASNKLDGHDALRVALLLADDLGGGWTNRTFSDASHRFEQKYFVRHGWSVVLLWASEAADAALVRRRTLSAVHRTLHQRERGLPKTLDAMLAQEGSALCFAGEPARYDDATLARIARIAAPRRGSAQYPTIVPVLYGDAAAEACGYDAAGVPAEGGLDLARSEACAASVDDQSAGAEQRGYRGFVIMRRSVTNPDVS